MPKSYNAPPPMSIDASKTYEAILCTTEGDITVQLLPEDAPMTVNNFVFLAKDDFYDGVKFHRIIKDFMVQTGDPMGTGMGGPGYKFQDEPVNKDYKPGTLAMANAGPNTNGSQFFIMHGDYSGRLPKNYTIFGQVTAGLDVLDKIANSPVTRSPSGEVSTPTELIQISDIKIIEQ